VEATLPTVGLDDLRAKLDRGEVVLVDALSLISYAASHLPGAVHIPPDLVDERAPRRIPDLDSEVVVYCSNPDCESSVDVGKRLVELGYTNVRHFPGGKREWTEAGLPLEGGRV
jgi:rhodanese-related sulfurtransferase